MSDTKSQLSEPIRILSLDIRPRRIGYVVFEGPASLLDWGVMRPHTNSRSGDRLEALFKRYQPFALVLRKIARGEIRNISAARAVARRTQRMAKSMSVPIFPIARSRLIRLFGRYVNPTKQEIASLIAASFPELAWRLPPPRKPWEHEQWNMSLFDSAALGLTYFADINASAVAQLLEKVESFRRPLGGVAR